MACLSSHSCPNLLLSIIDLHKIPYTYMIYGSSSLLRYNISSTNHMKFKFCFISSNRFMDFSSTNIFVVMEILNVYVKLVIKKPF